MKTIKIAIPVLFMFGLLACGESPSDTQVAANPQSPSSRAQAEQKPPQPIKKKIPKPSAEEFPVIAGVKFLGPARSQTDLELEARLEKPDPAVRFDYRWFVNDREVIGAKEPVLPAHHFSSGDWVHCRVTAVKDDLKSRMVKSKYIMIMGAPPKLDLGPVPEFSVPGTFAYRIKAIDPDTLPGEENTLSYELISPTDLGITLDNQTGQLKWDLTEETIEKLREKIEIKFKVVKKGAPEVHSSITLTFSEPEPETKETQE